MKKLLYSILALASVLTLVACSPDTKSPAKDTVQSAEKTTMLEDSSSTDKGLSSIEDFKTTLEKNGITITETRDKEYTMIQAIDGKAFDLEDGSTVEVYKYENNDTFKKIKTDHTLLDQPVDVYGDYVVWIVNPSEQKDRIVEIFNNSFK